MSREDDLRLGRFLDYKKLKEEVRSNDQMACSRYAIATPFVNEHVDKTSPLDRIRFRDQWFERGDVVSRLTRDNHRIFSQVVSLFCGTTEFYYASLIDLRLRDELLDKEEKLEERPFNPQHYEATEPNELLLPLSRLTYVHPTPTVGQFYNPNILNTHSVANNVYDYLKHMVDEERDYQSRTAAPNGLNPQQLP
ncbi:hypothetical protein M3Y98_01021100 [Aphelenchoides besseyi]|nr:hypothetical protein M3Y98_01021100 [Aphelenchoides besseyi]KAI6210070.1 hypothetical protein M3Y96_00288200 [Aphelenchoides besseyi]